MVYPKLTDKPGALETAAAIRAGELSPHEAVEAAIARIEHLDAHINAVAVCDFERAIETARSMDGQEPSADQPLFGVPMTIKESYDIAGLPTSWGFEEFKDNIANADSHVAQKLKQAGAVLIGKTNVPQNLVDWQSSNPVYGRTNNPHNHSLSPGGSSGGSAAAVASGMVPCDYGGDIGGSVRVPAHFCGVWGHKTSFGLIDKRGHEHPGLQGQTTHENALSTPGPLARNAQDLSLLVDLTSRHTLKQSGKPIEKCKFLLISEHPDCPVDASVSAPTEAAMQQLENTGVQIYRSTGKLPDLAAQNRNYIKMKNIVLARGAPAPNGMQANATDWFDLLDIQAQNEAAWASLFEDYDFVLAPPVHFLAVPHLDDARVFENIYEINGLPLRGSKGLAWSGLATFPNLPSTVLPIGENGGLPCGIQVIGPRWSDLDCISAAAGIDRIVNGV